MTRRWALVLMIASLPLGTIVDDAIRRLVANPGSPWARRNRVVGGRGAAWLLVVPGPRGDHTLYWGQPHPESPVRLLLLLKR
jgi:hypothetical protein